MSDLITINTNGLEEAIRCTICKNPNRTERGCDGSCQYDKEILSKIIDAVKGLADDRTHGEWIESINDNICSVCKQNSLTHWKSPFCPCCGAKMHTTDENTQKHYGFRKKY